ncbi:MULTISPECIES: helix-turn-helix domain-containing protein [Chryseobacterium]|uniref:Insertion element IS150 protein InsJ-like helix-turn-helix domain-containing protein n=2 Tax=Chryseobacterium TaxID=59732 RepID=A0A6N4XAE5_9FLAO|nr:MULTISPECIES: helix-turn-helix domain-containing protein [Chryseobacterium]CAA7196671.1 hypothetical protein CHRY9293_02747 [Chryseobacterium potabilaquae]CAA7392202.1 hypothetical protein CHRY9393_03063 [Chryseobacterium fistulae]
MKKTCVNYKLLFLDILDKKYPEKKESCRNILKKQELSILDIIDLNRIIFGCIDQERSRFDQNHRSYNESSVFQILDYQKKHKLNNSELARHFKLSRHTVRKWKNRYQI